MICAPPPARLCVCGGPEGKKQLSSAEQRCYLCIYSSESVGVEGYIVGILCEAITTIIIITKGIPFRTATQKEREVTNSVLVSRDVV